MACIAELKEHASDKKDIAFKLLPFIAEFTNITLRADPTTMEAKFENIRNCLFICDQFTVIDDSFIDEMIKVYPGYIQEMIKLVDHELPVISLNALR